MNKEQILREIEDLGKASHARAACMEYLTEHPEDEYEPLTKEWLVQSYPSVVWQVSERVQLSALMNEPRGLEVFVSTVNTEGLWRSIDLTNIKTRGQLRQLIKLLKGE